MTVIGWIQILLYCAIVVAIVPSFGAYMTRVFSGERTFLSPVLRPVEAALAATSPENRNRSRAASIHSHRDRDRLSAARPRLKNPIP